MADHKFKIDDKVKLAPGRLASNRHPMYRVMHLLPADNGINHYRIKSLFCGSEYDVRETELS
jgi:hypothetical protein